LLWIAALWETRCELQRQAHRGETDEPTPEQMAEQTRQHEIERLFGAAQASYLAGDWAATERSLLDALRLDAADIECQLMLATLWRRTGRTVEATRRLRRLSRLDAALPWQFEIHRELGRMSESSRRGGDLHDHEEQAA
jgi:Tfp pilus assembly protein PilF